MRRPVSLLAFLLVVFAASLPVAYGQDLLGPAVNSEFGDLDSATVPDSSAVAEQSAIGQWLRTEVSSYPTEFLADAIDGFVDDLRRRDPVGLDRLRTSGERDPTHLSSLLRNAGAALPADQFDTLQREIAQRRLDAFLATEGTERSDELGDGAAMLQRLGESSQFQQKRLVQGRIDDRDLRLMIAQLNQSNQPDSSPVVAAEKRELTAGEIVGEYQRRNAEGAALNQWRAYSVHGTVTGKDGRAQEFHLFKLRPDRFRLVMRQEGLTQMVLASDGRIFWMQPSGGPPRRLTSRVVGDQRHLAEFFDPLLLAGGNHLIEKLPDGEFEGTACFKIKVSRLDGSSYVAFIDQNNFRQIGRENTDGTRSRYGDFKKVGGLNFAHQENVTSSAEGEVSLVIDRITPNPGLITEFFQLPDGSGSWDYFAVEALAAQSGKAMR